MIITLKSFKIESDPWSFFSFSVTDAEFNHCLLHDEELNFIFHWLQKVRTDPTEFDKFVK